MTVRPPTARNGCWMSLRKLTALPFAVTDGRGRFREIYDAVRARHGYALPDDRPAAKALIRWPDEPSGSGRPVSFGPTKNLGAAAPHVVIVPGLVADCARGLLTPFYHARTHLQGLGYRSSLIWVNGRSGPGHNATIIARALAQPPYRPDERVVLIGYSKGAVDCLQALVAHPAVRDRTVALVSLAGVIGGTPLARRLPEALARNLERLPLPWCAAGDDRMLLSLRPALRRAWLRRHALPAGVRYYSLAGLPAPDRVSRILQPGQRALSKFDPNNDSQVILQDALIPGSTVLGFANADHWALTLPIARRYPWLGATLVNRNDFPREVLLESIVRAVAEDLASSALKASIGSVEGPPDLSTNPQHMEGFGL